MTADGNQNEITQLLAAWQHGDPQAAEQLFPLVYGELRAIARRHLGRQPGQTLQATAVVHEAYPKLVGSADLHFANRGHFFSVAAMAMRQLIVDHARRAAANKRGGHLQRVDFEEDRIPIHERAAEILLVDEALDRLEQLDPRLVRIVEMRFFGGLNVPEIASALGTSSSTIKREWQKARAFLHAEMEPS